MAIALDIVYHLYEIFGEQGHQARREATWVFMNFRRRLEQCVRDHMMTIATYLNEAQILEVEIDVKTDKYGFELFI